MSTCAHPVGNPILCTCTDRTSSQTFELVNPTMAVLRDDVTPSIVAIVEDETPLSCLAAKTGRKVAQFARHSLCDKHLHLSRLLRMRHGLWFPGMPWNVGKSASWLRLASTNSTNISPVSSTCWKSGSVLTSSTLTRCVVMSRALTLKS